MATLIQAIIGGVPTLIDSSSVARQVVTGVNGATPLTTGMYTSTDNGSAAVSPADATLGKAANGYVAAGFAAGGAVTYFTDGVNTNVTGLTPGKQQYLTTNGGSTTTPPEPASGQYRQKIGQAINATSAEFFPDEMYIRA